MIAQWCQPTENIVENEIADQLDALAEEVKTNLAERQPLHPLVIITEISNEGKVFYSLPCLHKILRHLNT